LSKPDSFSFAYDVEENQVLGATSGINEVFQKKYPFSRQGRF
jgi:hypothetical protein